MTMLSVCATAVDRIEPVIVDGTSSDLSRIDFVLKNARGEVANVTAWPTPFTGASFERLRRYADAIAAVNRDMDAAERRATLALVPEDATA